MEASSQGASLSEHKASFKCQHTSYILLYKKLQTIMKFLPETVLLSQSNNYFCYHLDQDFHPVLVLPLSKQYLQCDWVRTYS